MLSSAFKPYEEYIHNPYGLPRSFTLANFALSLQFGLGAGFVNSLLVVIPTVIVVLLVASLAAFAAGTMRFRGRQAIQWGMLALLYVPGMVLLLPLIVMISRLGLLNQRWVLVLLYATIAQPFGIYFLTNYIRGFPGEIFEAARIDGASTWDLYWRIALPLSLPALATLEVLNFLETWNELLWALLFLRGPGQRTLMVMLTVLQSDQDVTIPQICASLLLGALPVLAVFFFLQRQRVNGITTGAVK